jgi:predicted aspartyl protease
VPAPVTGLALIDTGASGTCIDDDIAAALQLPIVDTGKMTSATEEGSVRNIYPVQIEFVGWNIRLVNNRAMGATLKSQGLQAIIGRDMLRNCILVYNGPSGTFSLAI